MPLPNKITILEMLKFRESNDGKDAIAVINPDGTLIGGPTVAISSSATLYAVVNTTAAGQASVALDTGSKWIGLATVYIGGPTIFAVVNTAAAGNTNALATLLSGPNQIGSVTISNNPTLGAGSNYVGLASVNIGGTLPALTAGTAYIGLALSLEMLLILRVLIILV